MTSLKLDAPENILSYLNISTWHHFKLHTILTEFSIVIQRPKIFVYLSCIKFLWSCMYRYTRYMTFSCIVYRTLICTCTRGYNYLCKLCAIVNGKIELHEKGMFKKIVHETRKIYIICYYTKIHTRLKIFQIHEYTIHENFNKQ